MSAGSPTELRLAAFLVLLAPSLVASELIPDLGLGSWIDGRLVFGALVPLGLALFLTDRSERLGLGLGEPRRGLIALLGGAPAALLAVAILSTDDSVGQQYTGHGGSASELAGRYALSIAQVEICFRGAVLFGLRPHASPALAIAIATLPYVLVHLDKPLPEALGSAPVGAALGALALWTGSVWYGAAIHLFGAVCLTLIVRA